MTACPAYRLISIDSYSLVRNYPFLSSTHSLLWGGFFFKKKKNLPGPYCWPRSVAMLSLALFCKFQLAWALWLVPPFAISLPRALNMLLSEAFCWVRWATGYVLNFCP